MSFAELASKRRIFGVDFSAAKDAGSKIWISEGVLEKGNLSLLECYPLYECVPGRLKDRDVCLPELKKLIARNERSVFGLDFPFSVPEQLMSEKDWFTFVRNFPQVHEKPEFFRNTMQERACGSELKRLTDHEVKAPFSVYNLRIFKQTYHGICDILNPIISNDKVSVLPMQEPLGDRSWIMEVCPASTLKKESLYISYKGNKEKHKKSREYIMDKMLCKGIKISEFLLERIVLNRGGDALDSFIAAYASCCALDKLDDIIGRLPPVYMREGYTFF